MLKWIENKEFQVNIPAKSQKNSYGNSNMKKELLKCDKWILQWLVKISKISQVNNSKTLLILLNIVPSLLLKTTQNEVLTWKPKKSILESGKPCSLKVSKCLIGGNNSETLLIPYRIKKCGLNTFGIWKTGTNLNNMKIFWRKVNL